MIIIQPKDSLKMHKMLLVDFWRKTTEYTGSYRKSATKLSRQECIDALIEMGNIKLVYRSSHTRKKFNKIKHRGKYQYRQCLACGDRASVRHHIIWLRNGGRNNKLNIAGLCTRCHSDVHPWLKEKL